MPLVHSCAGETGHSGDTWERTAPDVATGGAILSCKEPRPSSSPFPMMFFRWACSSKSAIRSAGDRTDALAIKPSRRRFVNRPAAPHLLEQDRPPVAGVIVEPPAPAVVDSVSYPASAAEPLRLQFARP